MKFVEFIYTNYTYILITNDMSFNMEELFEKKSTHTLTFVLSYN